MFYIVLKNMNECKEEKGGEGEEEGAGKELGRTERDLSPHSSQEAWSCPCQSCRAAEGLLGRRWTAWQGHLGSMLILPGESDTLMKAFSYFSTKKLYMPILHIAPETRPPS